LSVFNKENGDDDDDDDHAGLQYLISIHYSAQ